MKKWAVRRTNIQSCPEYIYIRPYKKLFIISRYCRFNVWVLYDHIFISEDAQCHTTYALLPERRSRRRDRMQ